MGIKLLLLFQSLLGLRSYSNKGLRDNFSSLHKRKKSESAREFSMCLRKDENHMI